MVSASNNWSNDSEAEDEESEIVATVAAYYFHRCLTRKPSHNRPYSGWDNLLNLLNNVNEHRCYENLRMRPHVFYMLCETLVHEYGLRGTPKVTVQEKLATLVHECSAHDTRILSDAINDPHKEFLMPSPGHPNSIGFMTPYKGQIYYLPDFHRARTYNNEYEKFNHVHSSLRSAIERSFGIWKAKFHILNDVPVGYSFEMQSTFVCSTMALHNFIRRMDYEDRDFVEFNNETMTTCTSSNDKGPSDTRGDQTMTDHEFIAGPYM